MSSAKENIKRGTEQMPISRYNFSIRQPGLSTASSHWHNEIEIIFVKKGEILLTVEGETIPLKNGEIAFINPNELHTIKSNSEHIVYSAFVFNRALITFPKNHFFEIQFTEPIFAGKVKFPRIISPCDSIYNQVAKPIEIMCETPPEDPETLHLLLKLLITILKNGALIKSESPKERLPEFIKQSLNIMNENYASCITLSQLAEFSHLTQNYFCFAFKKHLGITPFEQLRTIRIEKATKLLLETDLSIEEIAAKCGFQNVGYFIKSFKKLKLTTPHNYRKSMM